jgi:hypothetical protein
MRWEAQMCKYLIILIGICLIASSALGADSGKKIIEPFYLEELELEEMWNPMLNFKIREDYSDDRNKHSKIKLSTNIWESDNISFPLTVKINNFDFPKAKFTLKIAF